MILRHHLATPTLGSCGLSLSMRYQRKEKPVMVKLGTTMKTTVSPKYQ